MTMSLSRFQQLLAQQALRFCADRPGLSAVTACLRAGPRRDDVDELRAALVDGGEVAFYAAVALACVADNAGLAVLRDPHAHFVTNSCVELGLALCARAALGDVDLPVSFINASMLGELAVVVGAFPPR